MASLFLVGNINEHTFANAALAAHTRDIDVGGSGLLDIFVLHSRQSERYLTDHSGWKDHLSAHGLDPGRFVNHTVDLHEGGSEQLRLIAHHVERFVLGLDRREDVYVDLTNGNSLYKSVLSNIAYLLGVRRQFVIDTRGRVGFLDPEELKAAYVELPDPSVLDSVAPAWLTEVRRFNVSARDAARVLASICGAAAAKRSGFEGDIQNAVQSWFRGEKLADGSALGGAVMHVGRAFEDLLRGVHEALFPTSAGRAKMLNDMLGQICSRLNEIAPDYEPQLLDDVAQLLRRLRNASTHEPTSPDFGRIRARLSTELLLATSEYLRILHFKGLLEPMESTSASTSSKYTIEGRSGHTYFFGLDGDDTGRKLEGLFQSGFEPDSLTRFSMAIDAGIRAVSKKLTSAPIQGALLFCSGDDLLFRGKYDADAINELRATYARASGGHTCSIGFGRTPKEAYVALKMAKATPGKDAVMGVELISGYGKGGAATRPVDTDGGSLP
jgi:hypothetical protein